MLKAHSRFRGRVLLLRYDDLVLDTEKTMRRVAEAIGISMSSVLFVPTFNGQSIRANSSARVDRYGLLPERVRAYERELDLPTRTRITELVGHLYERASAAALRSR